MQLESILNKYSKLVEPAIAKLLTSHVDKKRWDIVKYPVSTGGKRLRPALTLISCQLAGGKLEDAIYPAAGLEILHNYSLIVDDMIDNSTLRRNMPTAWAKFGNSMAQCIGAYYAATIPQAANKSAKRAAIAELFAKALKTLVDGEIMDILFECSGRKNEPYIVKNRYKNILEKDYFDMVSGKTAALFSASCEAGGICASAGQKQLAALKNYGMNLGLAFQIQDDILDMFGKTKTFGKEVGKDIIERKGGNIVIMLALKTLPEAEKKNVLSIMAKEKVGGGDVKKIMKLIEKTDSFSSATALQKKFLDKAKASLNLFPKNEWNALLAEIADYLLTRQK